VLSTAYSPHPPPACPSILLQVGGLGDVVHGLARTCLARGHNVTVVLPFYECLPQSQIEGLGFDMDIDVPKGYTWDGEMQVRSGRAWGLVGGLCAWV
jgi:starch synthase